MRYLLSSPVLYFTFALFPVSILVGQEVVGQEVEAQEPRRIQTAEAQKEGVGQNIGFVERLINESVAARQILESDNHKAHAMRQKALKHLQEAKDAEAQGDSKAIAKALREAKQAIFMGMRLVGENVVKDKKRDDYNRHRKSLNALLEAHKRIVAEKGKDEESVEVGSYAQNKIKEAQLQFNQGNFAEALNLINSAYLSVKLSLTKLREGETLVRSLHFASKEDEYRYELGRNDTHNMLVNTVLKEKRADPRLGKLMDIPMNQAEQLRNESEAQADSGDFETAIKTMEESTKQIIRAIRMAGIFIPG